MFNINANLFRVVHMFVSTEETRYYLNGVHIERHPTRGAILAATDGHRAFVAHDADAVLSHDFEPVIVRLDKTALAACKAARGEASDRRLIANSADRSQPLTISSHDNPIASAYGWHIDGTFPDWRRIVPNVTDCQPSLSGAFNAAYLDTFGKASRELTGARGGFIQLSGREDGPYIVNVTDPRAFGVLMPLRWKHETGIPAWLNETPEIARAA